MNPNNLSIVTGVPPSVHGICGNYFYDRDADAEVMMNDPKFLRVNTIFKAFQEAGARVAAITAKDKLSALLGKGLALVPGAACAFSAEKADRATLAENGVEGVLELAGKPLPSVYSADLSEFVFAAGVSLMARDRPDIMYLSTTDYVQHKHAPGTPAANDFYRRIDPYLAELERMGCTLALTADHGMNAKHNREGLPDVIYLQDLLDEWLGQGASRVILPITDPYVLHHGALGSFATIYLNQAAALPHLLPQLSQLPGVDLALTRAQACARFELPPERMGDIVIVSARHKVLGTSRARHDLSGLTEPLRSHGGVTEQQVPFLINRPAEIATGRQLRNFDIFEVALNHVL